MLNNDPNKTSSELTKDYARVSRYLQNVSAAVGELVLVINTLATISGRTRRVSELLETVEALDLHPTAPFKRREVVRDRRSNPWLEGIDEWLGAWKERCDKEYQQRYVMSHSDFFLSQRITNLLTQNQQHVPKGPSLGRRRHLCAGRDHQFRGCRYYFTRRYLLG